jgi:hypothetical protein
MGRQQTRKHEKFIHLELCARELVRAEREWARRFTSPACRRTVEALATMQAERVAELEELLAGERLSPWARFSRWARTMVPDALRRSLRPARSLAVPATAGDGSEDAARDAALLTALAQRYGDLMSGYRDLLRSADLSVESAAGGASERKVRERRLCERHLAEASRHSAWLTYRVAELEGRVTRRLRPLVPAAGSSAPEPSPDSSRISGERCRLQPSALERAERRVEAQERRAAAAGQG